MAGKAKQPWTDSCRGTTNSSYTAKDRAAERQYNKSQEQERTIPDAKSRGPQTTTQRITSTDQDQWGQSIQATLVPPSQRATGADAGPTRHRSITVAHHSGRLSSRSHIEAVRTTCAASTSGAQRAPYQNRRCGETSQWRQVPTAASVRPTRIAEGFGYSPPT